jgi:hypothetical protein
VTEARAPAGTTAPTELQGTWKLVSKGNPEKGLLFVISDNHYRVPMRLAYGDLVVDGDEILFYNAAICGLTLPDGIGRYRWAVDHDALRFELVGKEPCGAAETSSRARSTGASADPRDQAVETKTFLSSV